MRVALVHSFYRSGPSGENEAVFSQAAALSDANHEVQIIHRDSELTQNQFGFAIKSGLTVATGFGPSPLEAIRRFKPDLVHVHNLFPNWGDRWLSQLKIPLIATIHNFRFLCSAGTLELKGAKCDLCPRNGSQHAMKNKCYRGSRLQTVPLAIATRRPSENRLINRAEVLVFPHRDVLAQFETFIGGKLIQKATVVPNFVPDLAEVGGGSRASSKLPWIFLGRLSSEKGILPLVRGWPSAEPLQIIGSGPLESLVREVSAGKNITMLGQVDSESAIRLLSSSKGIVIPSTTLETGPLVFLEALRAGVPVLANTANLAGRTVNIHGGGRAFSEFGELARVIREVEENRSVLAEEARRLYEARYSEKTWLSAIEKVYSSALLGRGT